MIRMLPVVIVIVAGWVVECHHGRIVCLDSYLEQHFFRNSEMTLNNVLGHLFQHSAGAYTLGWQKWQKTLEMRLHRKRRRKKEPLWARNDRKWAFPCRNGIIKAVSLNPTTLTGQKVRQTSRFSRNVFPFHPTLLTPFSSTPPCSICLGHANIYFSGCPNQEIRIRQIRRTKRKAWGTPSQFP
jgi:hypothetical protein